MAREREKEKEREREREVSFSKAHTFSLSPPLSNKTSVKTVRHMVGMPAAILSAPWWGESWLDPSASHGMWTHANQ